MWIFPFAALVLRYERLLPDADRRKHRFGTAVPQRFAKRANIASVLPLSSLSTSPFLPSPPILLYGKHVQPEAESTGMDSSRTGC